MNSLTIPSHQRVLQGVSGRQKLVISLVAVFLLALVVLLAAGKDSHALIGAGAGAAVPNNNAPAADGQAGNISSTSVNVKSSSTNGSSSASVQVNGQDLPVSDPNNIHQTFTSNDGNSTVNINVENHSSTSGSGDSM